MASGTMRGQWRQANIRVFTGSGNTTVLNEQVLVINKASGAATTVSLPAGKLGRRILIKDGKGDAGSNNITIDGSGAETIDGSATITIATNYGWSEIEWNGTEWNLLNNDSAGNSGSPTFTSVTATTVNAGSSGTAGTLNSFPTTASKGKLQIAAADSAGNTTTTITNASQAGARTYTIPDAGASASFVMTAGAQTIGGVKTLTSVPVVDPSTGTAGGIDMKSTTDSLGTFRLVAADSAGDTVTTVTHASQSGARTYTIPDAGASASFMMAAGTNTLAGATGTNILALTDNLADAYSVKEGSNSYLKFITTNNAERVVLGKELVRLGSAASADGAITQKEGLVAVTKAGACAMTIADPTATTDDFKVLTIISATAQAHTLDNSGGSGFNAAGAGGDVGTFGGAIGDGITLMAYQGKWLIVSKVNVTLG